MTLKQWVEEQGTRDTALLVKLAHKKPVLRYEERQVERPRDAVEAQAERLAKAIAQDAGITRTDTLAQMDTKLRAMIAAAGTAVKPLATYKAAVFWTAYFAVRDLEGSGQDTATSTERVPILGKSPAEEHGFGPVTGDDIERALRV